jgi:hypothetical protein
MSFQILGLDGTSILAVESLQKAAKVRLAPIEYGSLGIYSLCGVTGVMAAGLAANSELFQFRYTGADVCLVREVTFDGMGGIVAFAAGAASFQLFKANAWTVDGSGGSSLTLSGDNNKNKTSMTQALSSVVTARVSSTAALTAGTKTLDANPRGSVVGGLTVTAGDKIPKAPLYSDVSGRYPIACVNQEGIVVRATVPATGTWTGGVSIVIEIVPASAWPG